MERILSKIDVEVFVKRRIWDIGVLIAGIVMGIYFQWNIIEILIFLIFVWSILGPIVSRYLAWPAILFLILTAATLFFGKKELAEEFSIYAYYFLVMTVIRGIIEARTEKNESVPEKSLLGK